MTRSKGKMAGILCLACIIALMTAGCRSLMGVEKKSNVEEPGNATSQTADMTKETVREKEDNSITENQGTDPDVGSAGNSVKNILGETGEAAGDMTRGAGKAVDDVADGLADALDNLGGGSFDRYEDARDYLMGTLQEDNAAAHYELRNEKKDLVSYNSNDSDAQGYEFSVYETDGNEKIGRYYVDKENGKIYRYMGKNSIEGY